MPRSRHNPHFSQMELAPMLANEGIEYRHLPGLGGFRKPGPDSANLGWRNESFRGYADYMSTAQFSDGLETLCSLIGERQSAMMCSEALPWRCHRSLVADALTVRGVAVEHIIALTSRTAHSMTPFARVSSDGRLTYPAVHATQLELF